MAVRTIGILGGGQLGLLLAQSISRLGAAVVIYDPDREAPASKVAMKSFHAPWNDLEALATFVTECDTITYEFENVDSDALADMAHGKPIIPHPSVLKITQNRAREKTFLRQCALPHVPFSLADNALTLRHAVDQIGYPVIIKSASGGYDGKMQFSVESPLNLNELLTKSSFDQHFFPAVVEKKLTLLLELSCITARSPCGDTVTFPVFENQHVDHILDTTLCPARVEKRLAEEITKIALEAAQSLGAYGLLCTEFFIAAEPVAPDTGRKFGEFVIYINEFAPRPHNSGHVTMSACTISQFDALARILAGVPLSSPNILAPGYFCMGNLLGDVWLAQSKNNDQELDLSCLGDHPETIAVILYGKAEARSKRKMGHFITYALEAERALRSAQNFRSDLTKRYSSHLKMLS
jgi:5-(carboxyamino)imidazole ribonucleotide synthase